MPIQKCKTANTTSIRSTTVETHNFEQQFSVRFVSRYTQLNIIAALPYISFSSSCELGKQTSSMQFTLYSTISIINTKAQLPGGGVYPEVLYTVARYWHELYLRQASEDTEPLLDEPQYRAPPPLAVPVPYALPYPFTYHPYPPPIYQLQVCILWLLSATNHFLGRLCKYKCRCRCFVF